MKVRLIGITAPLIDECNTADELIVYAARVSNPTNQANMETAPKLINYLAKHNHWSPFEMAHAVIEIKTTRDISRQILRHRSFSFQEFSQRYAEVAEFIYRECRLQDTKNRQNSIAIDRDNPEHMHIAQEWVARQRIMIEAAQEHYKWALDHGIAKEVARVVLPEGLTSSVLYMAGTIRSWLHYCQVRTDPSTQKEHREIAQACWDALKFDCPELSNLIKETS